MCTRSAISSPPPEVGSPGGQEGAGRDLQRRGQDPRPAAAKAFAAEFGVKWPKAAAKITDDLDVLLAFYDYPAEHWIHLRTSNPIESTFATVRLRTRVTKGPGSRAAGVAMAFKLIESAQARWRMVNAPHLVALVRAGALFVNGKLVERPEDQDQQGGISKRHETHPSTGLDAMKERGLRSSWTPERSSSCSLSGSTKEAPCERSV